MSLLKPEEILLEGHWVSSAGKIVADEAVLRIDKLVGSHLVLIGGGGWTKLFRDPNDGRLWEHTYPHSDWHGGGPPKLEVISPETARERYQVAL